MSANKLLNTKPKIALFIIAIILLVLAIAVIVLITYMKQYRNPADQKLDEADVVEIMTQVGKVNFNYAEGSDNGTALLFITRSNNGLVYLQRCFTGADNKIHEFAVDYPGHGKTTYPEDYPMTANQIGSELACGKRAGLGEGDRAGGSAVILV